VALAEGKSLEEAIPFANCAAAIAVTRLGAQSSIPARGEVEALMAAPALSF
jgi:ribokinase